MPSIPEQLLSRLSAHLAAQMGWHYPRERWRDLETGIESAARELGIADASVYAQSLLAPKLSQAQIEALAAALTIGETYFFRDPRSFEILQDHVFPALIRARRGNGRRLRIWSAGCCTGEEAYSIAILLDRLLPDLGDWQITLLATDVNTRFLHKAVEGTFTEWSFRGAPAWLKEHYFKPVEARRFELLPRIRSMVTFAYLNLGEDVYPSLDNNTNAMDLILCRNVLMYFSAERAAEVIRNFHRSLMADGLFLTSAVEISPKLSTYFVAAPFDGAVLYRKKSEFDVEPALAPTPPSVGLHEWVPTSTSFAAHPEQELLQAEPAAPREATDAYTSAFSAFERGSYHEAAAILRADPVDALRNVDRATLLARTYANLGDLTQARAWAERALDADRTNAVSQYLRAVILQEQNQITEALVTLQKTLYLDPDFVLAHFALGNLEQRQGRRSIAARHLQNAMQLLQRYDDNDVLPHSDGMAAGSLKAMIRSITPADAA